MTFTQPLTASSNPQTATARLRRELFWLSVAPCVIVALALIAWFAGSPFGLLSAEVLAASGIAALAWLAAWAWARRAARAVTSDIDRLARQFQAQAPPGREQAVLAHERFLTMASHELRQSLHAMGLFIDGLLPTTSPAQRPVMLRLQQSAGLMGMLLDDLLEISQLDARTPALAAARVPLAPLFERLAAQHAAASVRVVWRDRGLAVMTDAALLPRIISHLADHAIWHAPKNGTVLVIARRRPGAVRIEVRDNGPGIAPADQAHLFEEPREAGHTPRQGFGLGLPICQRIAQLLGSRIEVCSAPGKGSVFWMELPAG